MKLSGKTLQTSNILSSARNPDKADQGLEGCTGKKARQARNSRACKIHQKRRSAESANGAKRVQKFIPFDVRPEKACCPQENRRKKDTSAAAHTQNTKYDLENAKAASVIENLHRNKMSTKDMTQACVFLAESVGKAKAAQSLGISQQTLRKYLGFAAVPDRLKQYVPKELSRDDVTKLYQIIPDLSKATRIAEKITSLDSRLRKQYLKSLAKSSKSSHLKILKKAKAGLLQQRVTVELNKTNAKRLQRIAAKNDIEITEMADRIMSGYLKEEKRMTITDKSKLNSFYSAFVPAL